MMSVFWGPNFDGCVFVYNLAFDIWVSGLKNVSLTFARWIFPVAVLGIWSVK